MAPLNPRGLSDDRLARFIRQIGEEVRTMRVAANFTPSQLAQRVPRVSVEAIKHVEAGTYCGDPFRVLCRIATALGYICKVCVVKA